MYTCIKENIKEKTMAKRILTTFLALVVLMSLASCSLFSTERETIDETLLDFEGQTSLPEKDEQIAVVTTSLGTFKMKFFPEHAPKAVENFITLANKGHYDNTYVFCVQTEKMFLGGSKDNQGIEYTTIYEDGKPFENEHTDALWHLSGSVSTISTEKDKGDSRFFVIGDVKVSDDLFKSMDRYGYPKALIDAYKEYGGLPNYDRRYTVFAQVFEGIDVVNAINKVAVNEENGIPVEDVVIQKIEIINYGE